MCQSALPCRKGTDAIHPENAVLREPWLVEGCHGFKTLNFIGWLGFTHPNSPQLSRHFLLALDSLKTSNLRGRDWCRPRSSFGPNQAALLTQCALLQLFSLCMWWNHHCFEDVDVQLRRLSLRSRLMLSQFGALGSCFSAVGVVVASCGGFEVWRRTSNRIQMCWL